MKDRVYYLGASWKELCMDYGWYFEAEEQVIPVGYNRRLAKMYYNNEEGF